MVRFDKPQPSTWTLVQKLGEEVRQSNAYIRETYGGASTSLATFSCENASNPGEIATIKVIMQYALHFPCDYL